MPKLQHLVFQLHPDFFHTDSKGGLSSSLGKYLDFQVLFMLFSQQSLAVLNTSIQDLLKLKITKT